jgi:hypothetical protein
MSQTRWPWGHAQQGDPEEPGNRALVETAEGWVQKQRGSFWPALLATVGWRAPIPGRIRRQIARWPPLGALSVPSNRLARGMTSQCDQGRGATEQAENAARSRLRPALLRRGLGRPNWQPQRGSVSLNHSERYGHEVADRCRRLRLLHEQLARRQAVVRPLRVYAHSRPGMKQPQAHLFLHRLFQSRVHEAQTHYLR